MAILGPTTRPLVTAIQAAWLCGAATVMLPLPMRLGSIEEFVAQTRARILASDAALVIVDPQLAEFLDPVAGDPPILLLDALAAEPRAGDAYDRPVDDPDRLAILQYTSGSTSDPRGVILPHRCVTANADAIVQAADLRAGVDRGVSWLPLYHDMGLIGLLTIPMTTGMDLALAAPQDFLAAPAQWMQWCSDFGATASAGTELRVRARRARVAPAVRPRPVAVAARAERRRADRSGRGRELRAGRRAARTAARPRCSRPSAWPRRRSR